MIQPHSQELLGELAHDVAPEVEVVRLVPWRQVAGLELAGGIASLRSPAVAMLSRLPPMQRRQNLVLLNMARGQHLPWRHLSLAELALQHAELVTLRQHLGTELGVGLS